MSETIRINLHPLCNNGYTIDGVLHVGDPHASTRKPGTRNDKDFTMTVLGKIAQCIKIANQQNLLVVILGDLFDRENDADGQSGRAFLTKLIRILRSATYLPVVLAGNHDKSGKTIITENGVSRETNVTDDTTLAALGAAGVIHLIEDTELFLDTVLTNGIRLFMGGTPHGGKIPTSVRGTIQLSQNTEEKSMTCWITHEDMAFEGAYPGAMEMFEIDGCDIVVNGHMHLTKHPVQVGQTKWCNPGNITRQSKDCADHVPSVWKMCGTPDLEQIPLIYQKDVFTAVMNHVAEKQDVTLQSTTSSFVEKLKAVSQDIRTEDGSLILEDIKIISDELGLSADARSMLLAIYEQALNKKSSYTDLSFAP